MKRIFFLLVFVLFFFLFFFDNSYHLKIKINIEDFSPLYLDKNYAKNIEKEILKLNEIKDVFLISSRFGINIYCKIRPFSNVSVVEKIKEILSNYGFLDVEFDEKYSYKYDCFVVVFLNEDYYSLKNLCDEVLSELLKTKIFNKIVVFGLEKKVCNLYFSSDVLQKYNLNLQEIKDIIKKNNAKKNFFNDSKYFANMTFEGIEDIKNIPLKYKDSNFSLKFDDVFDIKKEVEYPPKGKIVFNNKNALVIALSRKAFCPIWYIKKRLKNFDIDIIKPCFLTRKEISLSDSSFTPPKNCLCFYNIPAPRISKFDLFDEIIDNRLIIFNDGINFDFLKRIVPKEKMGVKYEINSNFLSDYSITKKDVADSLSSQNKGLDCGFFLEGFDKIRIRLKSKDKFIYSKNKNMLLEVDSFLTSKLEKQEELIIRHKFKNPSINRRVKFQIR